MEKMRYKYRPRKKGVELSEIRCPICRNPINWVKPINSYQGWNYEGNIILLAECWSGNVSVDKSRHLFIIEINENSLPIVKVKKLHIDGGKA